MYNNPTNNETLEKTVKALASKGYSVSVAANGAGALEKIKSLIPSGASVMNGSSKSLEEIGYLDYLKTGQTGWNDLHAKIDSEPDPVKRAALRKTSVLSDFYLGSVHAVTVDGQMVVGSNTGSQLPQIVFTSPNLIFVIGTQKIVPDLDAAIKRLEEYVTPLENKRLTDLYGTGTTLNKVVIFKGENGRLGRKINIILVNEIIGF